MRYQMVRNLESLPAANDSSSRPPRDSDRLALAELMLNAYRGTIDDEGETLEDAMAEVDRTLGGAYGEFLGECSRVIERDGILASACLITLFQGSPWVSVSMTRPRYARQGLARGLMNECMRALQHRGYERIGLMVTKGNAPAEAMYRLMGFGPVEEEGQ